MEAMRAGRARAAGANVGLSTPRRSRGSSARREPGRAPPTASASLRSAGPLSRERKDHLSFLSSAPRRDLPGGCSRFHSKRKDLVRCFHSRKADKACASLADEVLEEVRYMRQEAKENEGVRYVLAIAGCPGSGKSTLAKRLCTKLNARASEEGRGGTAVVIPMDGYHYTRAELDRMQDPKLAHRRRGAHWTFDAEGFVSGSAIGYYGTSLGQTFSEQSPPGSDFLARVCQDWEEAAMRASSEDTRVVCLRTGLVLSKEGGVLEKMVPIFQLFVGSPLGQGDQWMSWIHRDDLCDLILHSAQNAELSGAVNGTAPEPQTMNTFCRDLAGVLERPMFMPPVPDLPLQVLLGEGAVLVLEGQKVVPNRAQETGFEFKYPKLRQALQHATKY